MIPNSRNTQNRQVFKTNACLFLGCGRVVEYKQGSVMAVAPIFLNDGVMGDVFKEFSGLGVNGILQILSFNLVPLGLASTMFELVLVGVYACGHMPLVHSC